MKLDRTLTAEIKKQANGDRSREAKFVFYQKAKSAAAAMSKAGGLTLPRGGYEDALRVYGRVPVAICTAYTILSRTDRLCAESVRWAQLVMELWHNRPVDPSSVLIRDENLHPTRIDDYARSFIRATIE